MAAIAAAFVDGPLRQPRAEVVIAAASFLQARIIFDHFLGFLGGKVEDKKKWRVWDSTAAARLLAMSAAGWPMVPLVIRGMGYKDGGQDVRGFRSAFLAGEVTPARNLLLASAVASARPVSDRRRFDRDGSRCTKAALAVKSAQSRY